MNRYKTARAFVAGVLGFAGLSIAQACEVEILGAEFQSSGADRWSVSVTLQHADSGWDHYADNWRVVDEAGAVLGDRVLFHPHVDEQPFTRALSGVMVPEGTHRLFIEAHDKVHGWSAKRLAVDLAEARDGRLQVKAR
ncbi:hypothetical protein A8C75_16030 [Marinobacterium aestuarii]|uniref:Uncharacterized protein n=1 Tax=Marinobacterium aestuarii TaxID=1821621 RepID=A0A1A9F0Z0_9GAMM|nr:hypothetical protein [Marinobacterium aestuarii]ANG63835.1 hypothetical protein A8C75_16030 [Marinobacterium aestuarii]